MTRGVFCLFFECFGKHVKLKMWYHELFVPTLLSGETEACPCCSRASPCTGLHSSKAKVRTGGSKVANLWGPFWSNPKAKVLWFYASWSHSAQPLPLRLAGCTVGHSEPDVSLCCKHVRGCALDKEQVLCSTPEICWGLHYIVHLVAETNLLAWNGNKWAESTFYCL